MYYKITNQESEVYQKLHKMRSEELVYEKENKEAIFEKAGMTFDRFLGNQGQQNWNRVTQYYGFVFNEPEKADPKIWKRDKKYNEAFVPNTRFKAGREMSDFISNGLKGHMFSDAFEILGLEVHGRFAFPYVEIAGDVIVVYVDDSMEPQDENLIEITKKEFNEILKASK